MACYTGRNKQKSVPSYEDMRNTPNNKQNNIPLKIENQRPSPEINFEIALGGLQFPGYYSEPVNIVQTRKIAIGVTEEIYIYSVSRTYVFRIEKFFVKKFSQQGEQDIIAQLRIADRIKMQTGKKGSDLEGEIVNFQNETRTYASDNKPFDALTSTAATGIPDNNFPKFSNIYGIGHPGSTIKVRLENQSSVFSHPVEVHLYGWTIPTSGSSRQELIRGL